MAKPLFHHLNPDWNAEPNAPALQLTVAGNVLKLSFLLNPWAYEAARREVGMLRFEGCSRWRWDPTNDEAWFRGSGRFSGQAPKWGEFYELVPPQAPLDETSWEVLAPDAPDARHFLFYFRDETIECIAADWSLERYRP